MTGHIHAVRMREPQVGIIGASGYSGLELSRLLARHDGVRLEFATSDRWVGESLSQRIAASTALTYVCVEDGLRAATSCAVVFLATPAESSLELAPKLLAQGVKVIDLAGTFRLKDASQYPTHYGFTHAHPRLLNEAVYGLPELFRSSVRAAALVANPGCYATVAALSLMPLVKHGLVRADSIVVNAASGVSGAGRKASEDFGFMEIDGDFRAYRVLRHQHLPEIRQTLARCADGDVPLVFTPHLLPVKRGILSTAVARLSPNVTATQVTGAFADAYGAEPLVELRSGPDAVRLADAVHTPKCVLGVATDGAHVVSIGAIDNLLKGAASQAVQNMNLLLGFPETQTLLSPGSA